MSVKDNTCSIIWQSDATQANAEIADLRIFSKKKKPDQNSTATLSPKDDTAAERESRKQVKLISGSLPDNLRQSCPITSRDPVDKETFQAIVDRSQGNAEMTAISRAVMSTILDQLD